MVRGSPKLPAAENNWKARDSGVSGMERNVVSYRTARLESEEVRWAVFDIVYISVTWVYNVLAPVTPPGV